MKANKETQWDANSGIMTKRQREKVAYEALVEWVRKMQALPGDEQTKATNALAMLISSAPASPSISFPQGLAYVDAIKRRLAWERGEAMRKASAETRRKIAATHPLAVEAAKTGDLKGYALVMMRKTHPSHRLPQRSF